MVHHYEGGVAVFFFNCIIFCLETKKTDMSVGHIIEPDVRVVHNDERLCRKIWRLLLVVVVDVEYLKVIEQSQRVVGVIFMVKEEEDGCLATVGTKKEFNL
jgi:hypothetical protein